MNRRRKLIRSGFGGAAFAPPATARLISTSHMVDSVVGSASNNRNNRKREYVTHDATGDVYVYFPNYYLNNVTLTNGSGSITINGTAEYNGNLYTYSFGGASSTAVAAGSGTWAKLSGLTSLTAGTFIYFNTRTLGQAGAANRLRGIECQARFDEGSFADTGSTDITTTYGRGATATATASAGTITAISFDNTGSNALYTNGDALIAYETQVDGTIRQFLIGTYDTSSGNPSAWSAAGRINTTGWAGTPSIKVCSRAASFGSVSGDIYAPIMMVATPTSGAAKQVLIIGDSNGHSSADIAQSPNGFKGMYERGLNGTAATANISYSGRKASDVDDISTGGLSTLYNLYLPYHNRVLYALGGNDAATDSAATITANINACATIYRNAGKEVAIATIPNRTTSTDSWTTVVNQTPTTGFATGAAVDTLNTDIRANTIVSNWGDPIDSRILSQDSVSTDKWKVVAPSLAITDGTHYNQFGIVNLDDATWRAMF